MKEITILHDRPKRTNQYLTKGEHQKTHLKFFIPMNPLVLVLFLISLATRCYRLNHPSAVVFDELHYIKFITLYAKRIFFFDAQPPLGKQLLTLVASLTGFKGDLSYSRIGEQYKPEVPIIGLRLLPCLSGSLIAPLSYLISQELGLRQVTAALVATLIIIENSLLTQSRFILIEPILTLLSIFSLYCYVKFAKVNSTSWLIVASISVTLATCTKYSGFYSYLMLAGLSCYSWWKMIDKLEAKAIVKKTITYALCILLLPIVIYTIVHYIHLSWLSKAGPHDNIMTSAFQASLEDGLATITRGQPLEIVHGSQITLRHTHGRCCWLHSHKHLYPLKYSDNRGSSHQQQVTCYSFKDVNNWWIVKRPHLEEIVVTEPYDRIKDGDLVQLVHGLSGRYLNSHDVASAMNPYSQEVSCYVDHNISMPALNLWRVHLTNPGATDGLWHTLNSRLQLIHLNSSAALKFSGKQLPDWGFHQHEIVADKNLEHEDTIWNVEEHRYTKSEDQKERERQLGEAEFVPLEPTELTFFEKFYELHYKLLIYQQDSIKGHIYACESPLDWLLMSKGTAYWIDGSMQDNAQIFLIGNTCTNYLGVVSISLFCLILSFYILRRRRQIYDDIAVETWNKIEFQSIVLLSAYFIHLTPYFLYETPIFLQNYQIAFVAKILIIGALMEHLYDMTSKHYLIHGLVISLMALSFDTFIKLAPLAYGTSLTKEQVEKLRWKDTWQLITVT